MNDAAFPKWFWIVAGLALLWNALGIMAFYRHITMTPEAFAALSLAQQDLITGAPAWLNIAFGVAVCGGVIGSIGLLLRKQWAFPVFIISLFGVIGQQIHMHFLSNTFEVMGEGSMLMPSMILLVAFVLPWFAHRSSMRGWLR